MKKLFVFTVGLFSMAYITASAQTDATPNKPVPGGALLLGPVVGFGNSWVDNMPGNVMFKASGYAGISLIKMEGRHWGWGGQIDLSSEGYSVDDYGSIQTVKPLYLRVPLRAYYFFNRPSSWVRPNLYLGPSFGLKLGETYTVSNAYYDNYVAHNSSMFRTFDAGVNGGAGLNLRLARKMWLNLDLGFYQGFVDAVKDPYNTYNPNHDVDLSASLLFNLR